MKLRSSRSKTSLASMSRFVFGRNTVFLKSMGAAQNVTATTSANGNIGNGRMKSRTRLSACCAMCSLLLWPYAAQAWQTDKTTPPAPTAPATPASTSTTPTPVTPQSRVVASKDETNANAKDSNKPDAAAKTNEVLDMSFDDIKFDIEVGQAFKREMLGTKIEDLNGKTIRIKGFIRPSFRQSGITKFVFVRDNQECCFGPGAAIYDCILVELGPDQSTEFTVRPITVKGEFYLREYQGPDGNIWAIFRMKNGVVE